MLSSNCAFCGSKKSRFVEEQEACGLLSSLGKNRPSIMKFYNWIISFNGIK